MRGTVILSHSELMTSGLMCLRINSDSSLTWLLRPQLRPPDKHSRNNALYLLDGFYWNHVCFIWYFEILKSQYFHSGTHFIPQTLKTYGDSVSLYFKYKEKVTFPPGAFLLNLNTLIFSFFQIYLSMSFDLTLSFVIFVIVIHDVVRKGIWRQTIWTHIFVPPISSFVTLSESFMCLYFSPINKWK